MKMGIIVFAYNRSWHLQKVLNGLKENNGVKKLYIFQDGLKCETDRQEWEATQNVINNINWCEIIYELSKENKGLAESIVYGVNKVFEENEAVIVLEDDCVPQPAFINYMKQCFHEYQNNRKVYSISGYSWPIEIKRDESDIYFCGRPCPWGWGTWKDRWSLYKRDYQIILDIKSKKESSKRLAAWGNDLEDMLVSNIKGITDSWYVFWSLLLIKNDGYAINPYESLIQNEGFDGTGVHCSKTNRFDTNILGGEKSNQTFKLPTQIDINLQVKEKFIDLYGSYVIDNYDEKKSDVLVYGVGSYYKRNAKQISNNYNIIAFVDKFRKDKFYAGINIIQPKQINEIKFDYIIIAIENLKMSQNIKKELIKAYGVECKKIKIGLDE